MRLCDWSSDVCSSDLGSAGEIVNRLLQNAWGEYLAVLADSDDSSAIALFRDPSGAMPCVYSLLDGEGFITSDIGIAVDLGLYRREGRKESRVGKEGVSPGRSRLSAEH